MSISVWVLGDQLMATHPALAKAEADHGKGAIQVLLVESLARLQRHPYHDRKLVLLLSAMRHYADELRQQGYSVDYRRTATMLDGIREHCQQYDVRRLYTMEANNWNGRAFQDQLSVKLDIPVTSLPNSQFLQGRIEYHPQVEADKRLTQERFYREMRRGLDLLMTEEGEPVGNEWNLDEQNREPLPADVQIPEHVKFDPNQRTIEVMEEIREISSDSSSLQDFDLAVTRNQAKAAAKDFFDHRLANFGTYEDAMSSNNSVLFHSRLSPYLNLGLLDPMELAFEAEKRYQSGEAPLNSVEGFIRQIVGWREYIYWQYWRTMPSIMDLNYFEAERDLPEFFWTAQTDMNCLRAVLERVQRDGYNHHIERLMVLSNYCLLTGIDPIQVLNWFTASYIDAYEWVMVPNVLGMGLYADGGLTSTKPYAASANYINKMSDYCQDCPYYRTKRLGDDACPFNSLYWNFMLEHESILRENPRMGTSLLGLRHFEAEERRQIRDQAAGHIERLHK